MADGSSFVLRYAGVMAAVTLCHAGQIQLTHDVII
jgi:hypothetical protein